LTGAGNRIVCRVARGDSRQNQIAHTIVWLRARYARDCRVDEMADVACMSRSTFHAHFKAVTSMTSTRIPHAVAHAGGKAADSGQGDGCGQCQYCVGLESPSQFKRDYARLFGVPPAMDAATLQHSRT
jgi:transcriptional regulator GlxA family with amidase domain